MRSALKEAGRLLDPGWVKETRSELKWLADLLGEVRDADVFAGYVEGRVAQLGDDAAEGGADLAALIRERSQPSRARLAAELESPRYLALLDRLDAVETALPVARSRESMRRMLRRRRGEGGASSGASRPPRAMPSCTAPGSRRSARATRPSSPAPPAAERPSSSRPGRRRSRRCSATIRTRSSPRGGCMTSPGRRARPRRSSPGASRSASAIAARRIARSCRARRRASSPPHDASSAARAQRASWKMMPSAVRDPLEMVLTPWRRPTLW